MKSILEKTPASRYVYFDNSGTITSITNRVSEDANEIYAIFDFDDILPFIDGTAKFTDYTVSRTDNPLVYEIVKHKVKLKQRNAESQISKITDCKDADIMIEYKDSSIEFSVDLSLVEKSKVSKNQSVVIAGTDEHPFFVTHKDRPEFLIDMVMVKFSDLLCGEKVVINCDYKYDISIYTRKYFDSYSLRRA